MKALLIFVFAIWSANTFAQTPINKTCDHLIKSNKSSENETSLKVIYASKETGINKPAFFINDKFAGATLLSTLNPMLIEEMNVVKDNIQIDGILYNGQIRIRTKDNYNPKIVSLQELKERFATLKNKPTIFMIDGVIINADYDNNFVDENYILEIIIDRVENTKEHVDLGLIKLLTKSEENIKKSKEIILRGKDITL